MQTIQNLINIAIKNKWQPKEKWLFNKKIIIVDEIYLSENRLLVGNNTPYFNQISMNDIVLNYKKGDVSFMQALVTASKNNSNFNFENWKNEIIKNNIFHPIDEQLEFLYNHKTTNLSIGILIEKRYNDEKIEWLLETFKHLNIYNGIARKICL